MKMKDTKLSDIAGKIQGNVVCNFLFKSILGHYALLKIQGDHISMLCKVWGHSITMWTKRNGVGGQWKVHSMGG